MVSLDDYRRRYGQYKARDALLALHARHPVYVIPDDHEPRCRGAWSGPASPTCGSRRRRTASSSSPRRPDAWNNGLRGDARVGVDTNSSGGSRPCSTAPLSSFPARSTR
ncbi:alkaline phosphatase D family protein [Dactylosporangium salmoneum]|uniref:alkaline phosphatase D family protein n=1 Tax=Dactylosporangium salmoneum TaxID=53361 RepID=UPI0031D91224